MRTTYTIHKKCASIKSQIKPYDDSQPPQSYNNKEILKGYWQLATDCTLGAKYNNK